MDRRFSLIRGIAVLAACTGLAVAQGPPNPPEAGEPGAGMMNRVDKIATVLGLSEGQKTQVKSIFQSSFSQAQPLFTQLRDNHKAIEQLVKGGASANFDQQLQNLANTQASLSSQLTMIHAKGMAQVWNLLTPDQRQKADQLRELFGPGFGGGPGRMMGRGMHHAPPAGE